MNLVYVLSSKTKCVKCSLCIKWEMSKTEILLCLECVITVKKFRNKEFASLVMH